MNPQNLTELPLEMMVEIRRYLNATSNISLNNANSVLHMSRPNQEEIMLKAVLEMTKEDILVMVDNIRYGQRNLLELACEEGYIRIVDLVITRGEVSESASMKRYATLAAMHGHENIIIFLGERNLLSKKVMLNIASRRGLVNIIKLLIDNGLDINDIKYSSEYLMSSGSHYSILEDIIRYGSIDILKLLIENNLVPSQVIKDTRLISRARSIGHKEMAELLISVVRSK